VRIKNSLLISLVGLGLAISGCNSNIGSSMISTTTPATTSSTSTTSALKVFTVEELATYNGQNGKPIYVAFYGIVYDVTNANGWENGVHEGVNYAGKDATEAYEDSPHQQSLLDGLVKVGTLAQ
jgi:predicted heme/steroid binding protein